MILKIFVVNLKFMFNCNTCVLSGNLITMTALDFTPSDKERG